MKDIESLPKWAQGKIKELNDKILRQNDDIEYFKNKLVEIENKDTNVFIREFPELIPLPRDSEIKFIVNKQLFYIVKLEDKKIMLRGSERLFIEPRTDNHIIIENKR